MVMVMGLATDEARLFGMAEANRYLPPGHARQGAAEVRRGFNLQQHIDDWWVVVATIHRRIGYKKNATLDEHIASSRAAVCEVGFTSGPK